MGERLRFNRLVLVGPSRNYEVTFHDGVNLIVGPIFTGKSSVLRLLDYACGARNPPGYPEILKCSEILVECIAGGELLTIRRSLRNPGARARIHESSLDDALGSPTGGQEVLPRHTLDNPSISSELMSRLGLGGLTTRDAPTQETSDTSSFGLRDLMLLCYVDQGRMTNARSGFFEQEPFKQIKWAAGFEIVHGIFDQAATQRAKALSDAEQEQHRIEEFLHNAERFLDDSKIPTEQEIDRELETISTRREELSNAHTAANTAAQDQLGDNRALLVRRRQLLNEKGANEARATELGRTLGQLGRLRVQYDRERHQLKFLEEAEALVGSLPVTRCPSCLQAIQLEARRTELTSSSDATPSTGSDVPAQTCYVCHRAVPRQEEPVSVANRLRAVGRRIRDLENYINELVQSHQSFQQRVVSLVNEVKELDIALDRIQQTSLLPSMQAVMEHTEALAQVDRREAQLLEYRQYRERARGEGSNLLAVRARMRRLREESELDVRASPEVVVGLLSDRFASVLADVRFPFPYGARLDSRTYRPVVRDQLYGNLESFGAIALVISSWHLALLTQALETATNFPMLLMLDSPLSHVGHDQADHEFRDQRIVDAFYASLLRLHEDHRSEFQLILVANRPPDGTESLRAVTFTGTVGQGRFGLIDDEARSNGNGQDQTENTGLP